MTKTREEVNEEVQAIGFPVLKVFDEFNPSLVSKLARVLSIVTKEEYDHLTPAEVAVISAVVSSSNGCEMWLSFHAAALTQMAAMSQEDLDNLIAGGLPKTQMMNGDHGRLHVIAAAAKTALAHKGIILSHEMDHLKALGIDLGHELAEIQFVVANVQGLNQILPHYVNMGVEIEDFLKNAGPFKNTTYKSVVEESLGGREDLKGP